MGLSRKRTFMFITLVKFIGLERVFLRIRILLLNFFGLAFVGCLGYCICNWYTFLFLLHSSYSYNKSYIMTICNIYNILVHDAAVLQLNVKFTTQTYYNIPTTHNT